MGKHLWDQNKKKLIKRTLDFTQKKLSGVGGVGKVFSHGVGKLDDYLKKNNYSISSAKENAMTDFGNYRKKINSAV